MVFGRPLPVILALSVAVLAEGARGGETDFSSKARSILAKTCVGCHGPEKQKDGLRLDVRESTSKGGDSGEPAIKPGDPAVGELLDRFTSADETLRMPPKGGRLPADQVELLRKWIAEG